MIDLVYPFSRWIFVPMYRYRHGVRNRKVRRRLLHSQFSSEDEIRNNQLAGIRRLIAFAAKNNKFYSIRFHSLGLGPGDINSFDDFSKIPQLTKDELRENLDEMISCGFSKARMRKQRTGGSTGVPIQVYWDDAANSFKSAIVDRHDSWAGLVPGMRRAALWGDTDRMYTLKERMYQLLAERTLFLDTLKMDDRRIVEFVKRLRRNPFPVLVGHAHSIYFFARYLLEHEIRGITFKGIISTAETLLPAERSVIEDVFGRVVFDRYGCEEVALIASECGQHDGMHISAEAIYLEIAGGGSPNPGQVIITDLTNSGMPLIRYEIGDLATLKEGLCACGRGLPRIGRVFGRVTDFLYSPEGAAISGVSILDTYIIHIKAFKQVQIVQDKFDEIIFRIIRSRDYSDDCLSELARIVLLVFGPRMKYTIKFVERIEATKRGKFQFSICNIKTPGLKSHEDPRN